MFKTALLLTLMIIAGIFIYSFKHGFMDSTRRSALDIKSLTIRDKALEVEIVDDLASRKQGLSGREALGENQGMLFIYSEPGNYSFWMKDMKFPIDIIWIGEDCKIVDITKNVSPDTFPQTFQPLSPAKYVLEVNASWADRNFIRVGDLVSF